MELKNCKQCGRTFGSVDGEELCKKCTSATLEEDFKKVRDYLYDNPGATIESVHEETGVEKAVIVKFLRQERIEIVEDENSLLRCQRCSISIKTGKYCDKCKLEIDKELKNAVKDIQVKKDERSAGRPQYHSKKIK